MHFESFSWLPPLVALLAAGLLAGFFAGMFGIGGGFIVVPAMLLVLPLLGGDKAQYAHVAVGTSAATIIVASIRSTLAHHKRGAVDFTILKQWAPWLVIGAVVGVVLAGHVNDSGLLLIFAIGLSLGGPTGYAINPARDLGPRIMHAILPIAGKGSSDWSYAWIPVVGPLVGGSIGALAWLAFFPTALPVK